MKKFFCLIPFQPYSLVAYCYQAVGNQKLRSEEKVCFPILNAIEGYVEPGEPFKVVVAMTDTENCRKHLPTFEKELNALVARRSLEKPEVIVFRPADDQSVQKQVELFQQLIDHVEDGDELFSCMTYGTKPMSQVVMMAIQYAYRIKKDTSLACIVYGEIIRIEGKEKEDWEAKIHDMTALVQIDEIVRILADRGVSNPKETIDAILSM